MPEPRGFGVCIEMVVFSEDRLIGMEIINDDPRILDMDGSILRRKVLEGPKGD